MTIFVDASALISIVAGESDAETLALHLAGDGDRRTSGIAIWETVAGLRRSHAVEVEEGRRLVELFLAAGRIQVMAIDGEIADLALEAYLRFGKGRHPAALNMGDCFAYACAKAIDAVLLYKSGDFIHTDLR